MRSDLKVIWAKMSYHFGADEEWAPLRQKRPHPVTLRKVSVLHGCFSRF